MGKALVYDLYLDLYFLENAVMDCLILAITGHILRYPVKGLRIILGGCAGAAWAVASVLLITWPPWLRMGVTILAAGAWMLYIAYGIRPGVELVKAMAAMYMTAFLMAGALYTLAQTGMFDGPLSLLAWLFAAAGSYFAILGLWAYVGQAEKRRRNLYPVTLYYQGKSARFTALMDTGNHLKEPVTGRPVQVITYAACQRLCQSVGTVLYVPYHSIGMDQGVLPAVWMDRMEIRMGKRDITVERPLIAICRQPLSQDGGYEMLVQEP